MSHLSPSAPPQPTVAPARLFFSPEKRTFLFSLLLIAGVLAAYSPVAHNGFLNYDDDTYITINPHVKAGLTRQTAKWAFTTYDAANYHPLTWLSHALDCELFGVDPAAHHEVSVLLHAACAVLLFLLLQSATGFPWRSLFVAALFALHPINVESVAWAAERKNVLSTLFFLLALHAYVWYARRPDLRRYALVVLIFALGLLSKPQVITLPFLLLLLDYWPLRRVLSSDAAYSNAFSSNATISAPPRSLIWLIAEKIPLLVLSVASAIITMKAQRAGGAVQTLSLYSPLLRLETAVIAYVRYLDKAFWPVNLVALYPHPTSLYPLWQVIAATLLLICVTAAVLLAPSRRYLAVGWFWFLIAFVPMIGLVQVGSQALADRYAYIPFIGLFTMLTWLVSDVVETRLAANSRNRLIWLFISASAILIAVAVLTYVQVGYWRDIPTFWTRTLALTENNYIAHDTLAEYLSEAGDTEAAAAHFRASLAIRPDDLPANLGLGTYDHAHGHLQSAIERYWIVALNAADAGLRAAAYGNLGSAYRQLGDLGKAKQCFERSLALAPTRSMPMIGLGLIARQNADLPEAVRQFSHAMAVEPTDVGYLLLAQALQEEGHSDEAEAINEKVARFSPNLAEAKRSSQSLLEGK